MSEECDRADCRSRAGLANLGSGRRLFVETSSGASIVPETARRFPVRRFGFGHPTRLRTAREHRRRLRPLREPARGAQADRRCRHLRQHRRAVRQEYHRQQCGGSDASRRGDLVPQPWEMDVHAADFGIVTPNCNRFPAGVDDLALHEIQREVLGRHSDPAPRGKLAGRSSEGCGVRHCIRRDAKRYPRGGDRVPKEGAGKAGSEQLEGLTEFPQEKRAATSATALPASMANRPWIRTSGSPTRGCACCRPRRPGGPGDLRGSWSARPSSG